MNLLDIKNLSVRFGGAKAIPVVDGLDLSVAKGEVLAIVGESGSGKSVTMMALMGLIDAPGIVTADSLQFDGTDMLRLKGRQRRHIVGKDLSMVFQDPMTSLNPSFTVGFQIEEVLHQHLGLKGQAARQRALQLLDRVEIPAAASRLSRSVPLCWLAESGNSNWALPRPGIVTLLMKVGPSGLTPTPLPPPPEPDPLLEPRP